MGSFCAKGSVKSFRIFRSLIIKLIHARVFSRPIMGYLVSKYAKNDSLYPRDPRKRGVVDQMLYFDIGTLNENVVKCYVRIFYIYIYILIFFIPYLGELSFWKHQNLIWFRCTQYSVIFFGAHSLKEENVEAVERSCEVLNAYLEDREYVAGDALTIADFAIHTTICVLLVSVFPSYIHIISFYLLSPTTVSFSSVI